MGTVHKFSHTHQPAAVTTFLVSCNGIARESRKYCFFVLFYLGFIDTKKNIGKLHLIPVSDILRPIFPDFSPLMYEDLYLGFTGKSNN